ncbi:DUF2489 domain-containing protein [Larsenimonas salina]|uniref:DUF2489 domain-containing protein n=1 Tax=Larsenimonas salina TaxID=1295565 RepID=UPI0020732C5F|nr:DUF2489 domain-containing protein [Larsenimonas salina]MCM5703404.1 DUF2489 domain-containing protein [Larsenimonas salina]
MNLSSTVLILALIIGVGVVLGLALYAKKLWGEVGRRQKQAQAEHDRAKQQCLANLDVLSQAVIADQVDLIEGVLRCCVILDIYDAGLFERPALKPLLNIREKAQRFHTHDARQELTPRERMKEDKERLELAGEYRNDIRAAAFDIQTLSAGHAGAVMAHEAH